MSTGGIGVFGGTFNPIHKSHLYLIRQYISRLPLEKLFVIPTYIPPHKQTDSLVDAHHRLEMCRLAVEDIPQAYVCDYEVERNHVSYTYETLDYLRQQFPNDMLYLLMGSDMFLTVQNWRQSGRIFEAAILCGAARHPEEMEALVKHANYLRQVGARECILMKMEPKPLSSTQIRQAIQAGQDASEMLPDPVWSYIQQHGLYTS